jgi:cytidylate kinase
MIIAIDGPAASGKGTLGKRLAAHFGLRHLDTGLLYRAVAHALAAQGAKLDDPVTAEAAARTLDVTQLDEAKLKARGMAEPASVVSAIPQVRAALVDLQRNFAAGAPGAVLDGRDIGTVICPDADAKLFLTARAEIRAERRLKELQAKGVEAIGSAVLRDMMERDARDAQRSVAPLEPAKDAFVLDTSDMDADAVFAAAVDFISRKVT